MDLGLDWFFDAARDCLNRIANNADRFAYRYLGNGESDEQRELREAREHLQRVLDLRKALAESGHLGKSTGNAVDREVDAACTRYVGAVQSAQRAESGKEQA